VGEIMKGYNVCKNCGQKLNNDDVKYFEIIAKMRQDFEHKYGENPTHIILGIDDYYNIENSADLLDRLIGIKDTTKGLIGTTLMGMRVIKSADFEGISVAKL